MAQAQRVIGEGVVRLLRFFKSQIRNQQSQMDWLNATSSSSSLVAASYPKLLWQSRIPEEQSCYAAGRLPVETSLLSEHQAVSLTSPAREPARYSLCDK